MIMKIIFISKLPCDKDMNEFKKVLINIIEQGHGFGEIALLEENNRRTATIKATDIGCELAFL